MGLHGCPMCHDNIDSFWDDGMNKTIYGRHRRALPLGHPMRYDLDHWFGKIEIDRWPVWPDGGDWESRWEEIDETHGVMLKHSGMKRRAIWNDLPYWQVGP